MTDFKVTDEAVETACAKFWPTWNKSYMRTDEDRRRMRDLIEAVLPVMFEHCGWRYWSEYPEQFRYSLGPGRWIYSTTSEWRPRNAEQVFRIKEPK